MNVLTEVPALRGIEQPVALAIGVFDGVHLGHQEVIKAAQEHAAQHGGVAVVMTFDPHPLSVLRPGQRPLLLCSTRHKLKILERSGVGHVLVCRFDDAFAAMQPGEFLKTLADSCRQLDFISVGYGWRFGRGGAGDIHLLMDAGRDCGFGVYGVPPVRIDGAVVSSTSIRDAVSAGDFIRAARLLGRDYTVLGRVVEGRKLGHQLGFPTANLGIESEQLPPTGVYAVRALLRGEWLGGVANLGRRPTVEGDGDLHLEVHLLDFEGDLYGEDLEVCFVSALRQEQKFASLDALKSQIARDVEKTRDVLTQF